MTSELFKRLVNGDGQQPARKVTRVESREECPRITSAKLLDTWNERKQDDLMLFVRLVQKRA